MCVYFLCVLLQSPVKKKAEKPAPAKPSQDLDLLLDLGDGKFSSTHVLCTTGTHCLVFYQNCSAGRAPEIQVERCGLGLVTVKHFSLCLSFYNILVLYYLCPCPQ